MPDYPLLIFPRPSDILPPPRPAGFGGARPPTNIEEQARRISEQFEDVEEHFGDKWVIENMHYTIIANSDDVLPKDTIFSSEEQYVKGIVNSKDVCEGMNFNTIVGTSDSPKIPIQELMYNQI